MDTNMKQTTNAEREQTEEKSKTQKKKQPTINRIQELQDPKTEHLEDQGIEANQD